MLPQWVRMQRYGVEGVTHDCDLVRDRRGCARARRRSEHAPELGAALPDRRPAPRRERPAAVRPRAGRAAAPDPRCRCSGASARAPRTWRRGRRRSSRPAASGSSRGPERPAGGAAGRRRGCRRQVRRRWFSFNLRLVASELVKNAVLYGAETEEVDLELQLYPGWADIRVRNGGGRLRMQEPPHAPPGRRPRPRDRRRARGLVVDRLGAARNRRLRAARARRRLALLRVDGALELRLVHAASGPRCSSWRASL